MSRTGCVGGLEHTLVHDGLILRTSDILILQIVAPYSTQHHTK